MEEQNTEAIISPATESLILAANEENTTVKAVTSILRGSALKS